MEHTPLVSVVVPIYNVEQFLPACIESIQRQTLQELEILLIVDGSPDGSGEIAAAYARADDRITVITKANGGLSSARNAGLAAAHGGFVAFIDSDDWIEPMMFGEMYREAGRVGADIVVSGAFVDYVRERHTVVDIMPGPETARENRDAGPLFWELFHRKLANYAWNKLFRAAFLREHRLTFIEDAMPAEDLIFNLTAFTHARAVAVLDRAFYHYMQRDAPTILSRYHTNLSVTHARRRAAWEEFFAHFSMTGRDYSAFLDSLTVHDGEGVVLNLYKRGCPHGTKERRHIIRKEIFGNDNIRAHAAAYTGNAYRKIFSIFLRYTNPYIMERGYAALFMLKRTFAGLYLRFRKTQLAK